MNDTKEKKVISRKKFEALRKQQLRRKRITYTVLGVIGLVLVLVAGYSFGVYEFVLRLGFESALILHVF